MTWTLSAVAGLAALAALATLAASDACANSISDVEGARANDRAGRALSRQEVEHLRRYGGNDDGYWSGGYVSGGYYGGGPAVGIYVGPGYGSGYGYLDDDDDDGYEYDGPGPYGPYGD